jgi:hypothetical protein
VRNAGAESNSYGLSGQAGCISPAPGETMERASFIEHRGSKILLIDFRDLDAKQLLEVVERARALVTAQPRDSVLTLADFGGSSIDRDVATRIKEVLVFDRPYVKRSAWVGVEDLPKAFYESFRMFSRRDFPTFRTREEAMDWLVSEAPEQLASPA